MGRRRRPPPGARPIHGWVVIDKPRYITSAAVVTRVLKELRATRAGHGGTLDPLATGVLPVALGEATKTMAYVMNGQKSYRFILGWGEARSTGDTEGEVTETSDVRPDRKRIEAVLGEFTGEISQVPPAFSAIKVDGHRAYKLARAGHDFTLEPRQVVIQHIELVDVLDENRAEFEVSCGKGMYIRSLARDIAIRLGTVGHVESMRRTRVGPFTEDRAISLDNLHILGHSAAQPEWLFPIEAALDDIPALALTESQAQFLRTGRAVQVFRAGISEIPKEISEGAVVFATAGGKPVALARMESGKLQPVRVLNL